MKGQLSDIFDMFYCQVKWLVSECQASGMYAKKASAGKKGYPIYTPLVLRLLSY
jgi:hypothetical protein